MSEAGYVVANKVRRTARLEWKTPRLVRMSAGSAELGVGNRDDGVDKTSS
jgi:hypothetical protein